MMIVPHHVYLMLSDLVEALKREKKLALDKASANVDNADECAFWAAYGAGMGDALILVKGMVDKI